MKKLLWLAWFLIAVWFGLNVHAYTPRERDRLKLIRQAVVAGIDHGKALQVVNASLEKEAEGAHIEADNANKVAGMAALSAFSAGVTARKAQAEAERAAKENAEMRPIVAAVTGPWWFPGLNALIYGAKKSTISLLVLIGIGIVVFIIIKVAITMFGGGTFTAGLKAGGGIFVKLGRWFGRAFKRLLSFSRRRGEEVAYKIEHKTIGSDPPDNIS